MRKLLLAIVVALGALSFALASPGGAAASVPLDMESVLPLAWNPLGVEIRNVYWDDNWDAHNTGFAMGDVDAATRALVASDYFEKSAQYGVPGRTFGGSDQALGVCGADPGSSVDILRFETFMACEKTAPVVGLPGAPQSVIYNLFVPERTTVNANGTMCRDYGAFHTLSGYVQPPPGAVAPVPVYFAVIPLACFKDGGISVLASAISHEDVEILTDPAVGLYWLDHDSAPPGLPASLGEVIQKAVTDPVGLFQLILQVNSEAADLCENRPGFANVPADFQNVPASPSGIDMQLAAYWSNADHACVVGNSRVVEATFQTAGLPAGAGATVLVDNTTRPDGYTHSEREGTQYRFAPAVTAGGHRYVTTPGCEGQVTFPQGNTTADAARTFTCTYRQQGAGPGAIEYSDGCARNDLPRNDDGSSPRVDLPLRPDFFGTTYTSLWVNNNGNVTFDAPMFNYTPFPLTTTSRVVIAPFFGDVDTRNNASSIVTFGPTTFGGRTAFCILWADVGVGYYPYGVDKLNSFQLLLVDRSDVGPGDFDIVMNYDKIQWEAGSASGGQNGLGGASARVGYSNGDPASSFELPGSAVNGALLDSSPSGLVHGSRNSTQPGRYIFEVRNGRPPAGGTIEGHVRDVSALPLANAPVQVCPTPGGACAWNGFTDARGEYVATGLADGSYTVSAFSPSDRSLLPATIGPEDVAGGSQLTGQDLILTRATTPPPGVAVSPSTTTALGLPVVFAGNTATLTVPGCTGGTATYTITSGTLRYAGGDMSEGPAGVYSATVPPLSPHHGPATVAATIHCQDGSDQHTAFQIYVDPSGTVRTPAGQPVPGATVTLLRGDTAAGPFTQVPDGAATMSPSNRANPDATDAAGHFGWDVISGYYKVRASHAGCHAPGNPAQDFVESPVVQVPPAVLDLDLRLDCPGLDRTPPTTTATLTPLPNAAGWNRDDVTVELRATDDEHGAGVAGVTFGARGAEAVDTTTVPADAATVHVTHEGTTTITFHAVDRAGNAEPDRTVTVQLDKTAPVVSSTRSPAANASGWNAASVTVSFSASDGLSGLAGPAERDVVLASEGASQTATASFTDLAGNSTAASLGGISIDEAPPTVRCSASPATLWPPNHELVPVATTVTVADALSGPAGFALLSAASSEPDNGLGDGDTAGDVQDWTVGDADTAGLLRAERAGGGPGRTYTLTYRGVDSAGNAATCATSVSVAHSAA